jgi:membrane protease YdiL (CAAX protease family)
MPQFFTVDILQYPVIYGIMFIPIYYTIRNQDISSEEMGMSFKKLYVYLPISVFIGLIMAIIEYKILSPVPLIDNINIPNVILITIVMLIFVGLVEEVIFRSIVQTRIEKMFGPNYGILLTGGLFGIMHASYGVINEIIFAAVIGIILSYIFRRTRNLLFVVSTHGIADIISFGILANIAFMI